MIYIVGAARSGKSTLAYILKEKDPNINFISTEAIYHAMAYAYKDMKVEKNSKQMADMIYKFAEWSEVLNGQKSVIDVGLMDIELINSVLTENDIIVCLGFGGDKSINQIWALIEQYHQEYDYTYTLGLDRAKKMWGDFALDDRRNKLYCEQNGIMYVDTSSNRDEKLQKVANIL